MSAEGGYYILGFPLVVSNTRFILFFIL